ncbi:MAG: hypothetical protein GF311_07105 [Candidatus Lokiarchaeota archaeon]|nr:hypothetical protein [Candidatus Lokiarchaeota archaeon]
MTRRGGNNNLYVLCYKLRPPQLPYPQFNLYDKIRKKYAESIKSFEIKSEWKESEEAKEKDFTWEGKEPRRISQRHINNLINTFTRCLDATELEVILNNSLLGNKDGTLTEKQLDQFGLVNNFNVLRKLFRKKDQLQGDDTEKIFQVIETDDFIILKQLFYVILKNSKTTLTRLYELYHTVKGKAPFPKSYLRYVWNAWDADDLSKLELFFKDYIHMENLIDKVREKIKRSNIDVKMHIPLKLKAYKKYFERYPEEITEILKKIFQERKIAVLNIFRLVLESEVKRLGINVDGFLVSYQFPETKAYYKKLREQKLFFDDLIDLSNAKLEEFRRAKKSGEIQKYIIFRGHYITARNKIDYDWSKVFKVRDNRYKRIECRITHNRTYFNELKIDMETEIEIQAAFTVKYIVNKKSKKRRVKEKYLNVIDINIIENFKVIKYHLATHNNGEVYLENTREGVSVFTYPIGKGNITQKKVLVCPINLLNVYKGQNDTFYELKLNGSVVCKTKEGILEFMEEKNLIIDQNSLKMATSNILRESMKEYHLHPKPMYNTVGVFFSKSDDDIIVVYDDDDKKRIIGENDLQLKLIERIKEKEMDKKGELTDLFYQIIHLPALPEEVRISVLGYTAIHPFFFVLSDHIDILPLLFLIGKHGAGKTTTLKIFMNYLFGTEIKKADDIRSDARFSKFLTEMGFCTLIDDFDKLPDNHLGFVKTYASQRGKRYRMKKNQEFIIEQLYASIGGTANEKEFLTRQDDEAFRLRCIIHELNVNIKTNVNRQLLRKFRALEKELKSSNIIYGYYLLNKAMEYIENSIEGELTTFKKLLKLFNKTYERLADIIEERGVEVIDIRRITVYTLLFLGLEIWQYVFESKGLKSEMIESYLNLEKGNFINYMQKLEVAEKNLSLEIFDSILEFFRQNYYKYAGKKSKEGDFIVQTRFISDYDRWARPRNYDTLKTLTKLAEFQSKLLNRDIKPATQYFFDEHNNRYKEYGVKFYYKEIRKLRGELMNIEDNSDTNEEQLDINNLFDGEESKKMEAFISRVIEFFEEGNNELELSSIIQTLQLDYEKDYILDGLKYLKENKWLQIDKDKVKYVKNEK